MAELTKTGESRTLRLIAANSRMGLAAAHRDRVNRHPAGAARSPKKSCSAGLELTAARVIQDALTNR